MAEPLAMGMVLAMRVDGAGKAAQGGAAKGQLYASADELVIVRPPERQALLMRATTVALLASVLLVVANLFTWKSTAALWIAVVLQAAYWLSLPMRRRAMEPVPLSAEELERERRAGRVLVQIPARTIQRTVPPEPPRQGFRKPARFELADGALEIYLSEEQFRTATAALGTRR